ncbi:peroxisome assembly protein 12 [Pelomyxa schiedti]|nr:peroxisome assembly protein 12 [Pelomyxa schiedti]
MSGGVGAGSWRGGGDAEMRHGNGPASSVLLSSEPAATFLERPTVFDVYVQDNLAAALKPALKFLAKNAGNYFPVLRPVKSHFDVIFYSSLLVAEAFSLRKYNASIAEHFYSLRRESLSPNATCNLSGKQKFVSLIFLVGVPALFDKLTKLHKSLGNSGIDEEPAPLHPLSATSRVSFRQRLLQVKLTTSRMFIKWFGWVKAIWELSRLAFYIGYMRDNKRWPNISFWLTNCSLEHSGATAPQQSSPTLSQSKATIGRLIDLTQRILSTGMWWMGEAARFLAPLLLFGYQSLEWWYSVPASHTTSNEETLPPPPPPQLWPGVTDSVLKPSDRCPLCSRRRTNEAVLASSGFAFCYTCIMPYVRCNSCCPLTATPSTNSQVWRLYSNTSTSTNTDS